MNNEPAWINTPTDSYTALSMLNSVVVSHLHRPLPKLIRSSVFAAIRECRRADGFPDDAAEIVDQTGLYTWFDLMAFQEALGANGA